MEVMEAGLQPRVLPGQCGCCVTLGKIQTAPSIYFGLTKLLLRQTPAVHKVLSADQSEHRASCSQAVLSNRPQVTWLLLSLATLDWEEGKKRREVNKEE